MCASLLCLNQISSARCSSIQVDALLIFLSHRLYTQFTTLIFDICTRLFHSYLHYPSFPPSVTILTSLVFLSFVSTVLHDYSLANHLSPPNISNYHNTHTDESQYITCGSNHKITYWDACDAQSIRAIDGSDSQPMSRYSVLYCTVLYCTVLYSTVIFCVSFYYIYQLKSYQIKSVIVPLPFLTLAVL